MFKHMKQNNGSKFQIMKLLSWEWFFRQSLWPLDLLVSQAKAMVMSPFLPQVPWRVVETNVLPTQHTFQIKLQKTARCELPKNLLQRLCSTQTLLMWPWSVKWQISTTWETGRQCWQQLFKLRWNSDIDVTCVLSWSFSCFLGPLDTKEMTTLVFFPTFLLFQYR